MPLTDLNHEDKQDLRRLVLSFFKEAKMSRNMHLDDHFQGAGYENLEIRQMMYALEKSGLIYKIRGNGPGSIYALTRDGQALMEVIDQIKAHQASNKGALHD